MARHVHIYVSKQLPQLRLQVRELVQATEGAFHGPRETVVLKIAAQHRTSERLSTHTFVHVSSKAAGGYYYNHARTSSKAFIRRNNTHTYIDRSSWNKAHSTGTPFDKMLLERSLYSERVFQGCCDTLLRKARLALRSSPSGSLK